MPRPLFSQRKVDALKYVTGKLASWKLNERLRNLAVAISDVSDLLNGKPSPSHLEGAFYRNRPASGQVVDAGLIWIAPVIPLTGNDVRRLIREIEPTMNDYGFDLPITVSPVVPRAAVCIANISYDKQNEEQTERARRCYGEINVKLTELGYPKYRSASLSMQDDQSVRP